MCLHKSCSEIYIGECLSEGLKLNGIN